MKKVGILTFHRSENYGSVLQAYALCKKVNSIDGYTAEIIDFIPPKQDELYSIFLNNNSIKNIAKNIRALQIYANLKHRKMCFKEFIDFLPKSSQSFFEGNLPSDIKSAYDIIICGSDQIWNPNSLDFSQIYFAKGFEAKKISYAPSMRNATAKDFKNIDTEKLLNSFSHISVREQESVNVIKKIANKDSACVIDPTLLLDKNDYDKIKAPHIDEDYIFYYSIDYNEESLIAVKKISNQMGLPVKILFTGNKTYRAIRYGFKLCKNNSPNDFLSLVQSAHLVLTTSFHGTALAVIYRKKFFALKSTYAGGEYVDARINTLLNSFDLSKRYINCRDVSNVDLEKTPIYNEELIKSVINKSQNFLLDALEN